jgi:hypothetical protein
MRSLVSQLARTEKVVHRHRRRLLDFIGQMSHSFLLDSDNKSFTTIKLRNSKNGQI